MYLRYYQCPVCGYDRLLDPPEDYNICPSCGTEFEVDDFEVSHAELRRRWMASGMNWYSRRTPQPADFRPLLQIRQLLRVQDTETTAPGVPSYSLDVVAETHGGIVTVGRNHGALRFSAAGSSFSRPL